MSATFGELRDNPRGVRRRTAADLDAAKAHMLAGGRLAVKAKALAWKWKSGYVLHLRVPSRSKPDVRHDVVAMLTDPGGKRAATVDGWKCGVFCNSPGWVYRMAWVSRDRGVDVPELRGKLPAAVWRSKPVRTNPKMELGWDGVVHPALHAFTALGLTRTDELRRRTVGPSGDGVWKMLERTVPAFGKTEKRR